MELNMSLFLPAISEFMWWCTLVFFHRPPESFQGRGVGEVMKVHCNLGEAIFSGGALVSVYIYIHIDIIYLSVTYLWNLCVDLGPIILELNFDGMLTLNRPHHRTAPVQPINLWTLKKHESLQNKIDEHTYIYIYKLDPFMMHLFVQNCSFPSIAMLLYVLSALYGCVCFFPIFVVTKVVEVWWCLSKLKFAGDSIRDLFLVVSVISPI